jgi:hypothetical protein
MKEYLPVLTPRRDYVAERDGSKFRSTIWQVIVKLNPHLDPQLNLEHYHFSTNKEDFLKQGQENFNRGKRAMELLNQAVAMLEKVGPLRESERSQRWRANYDLLLAQCKAYRVRIFQYLMVLDRHARNWAPLSNPKNNKWLVRRTPRLLDIDPVQIKATKVDAAELVRQREEAEQLFKQVIANHPRTPWANRSEFELAQGFGMEMLDYFWDPRYSSPSIKRPTP